MTLTEISNGRYFSDSKPISHHFSKRPVDVFVLSNGIEVHVLSDEEYYEAEFFNVATNKLLTTELTIASKEGYKESVENNPVLMEYLSNLKNQPE